MFEAGLFYTLIGLALVILIFKIPYREFLFWLSGGIFLYLSFAVFSGNDVAFYSVINDGVNIINQTNYIIGDNTNSFNTNGMMLAFILGVLGLVVSLIGLVLWVTFDPRKTGK